MAQKPKIKLYLGEIRKSRGKTQDEMATACDVPKRTYGSWERGEVIIGANNLMKCARILRCSTDEILGLPVRKDYVDPREAELHRIWQDLTDDGQDLVLRSAQAEYALERGGIEEKASPESDTRRVG